MAIDYPAWIVLFTGVYAISASVAELRQPGFWLSMVEDVTNSSAIRFVVGIMLIAIGGALYLIGPWASDDWMFILVKVLGAWMVIEGALILAVGDAFMRFASAMMGSATKLWVGISLLLGLAMAGFAAARLFAPLS
jgi:hypothetical protein